MIAASRPLRLAVAVAAVVVAVDQALKAAVVSELTPGDRVDVLPILAIVSTRNRGIAFGLLSDAQEWLVVAVTLIALVILLIVFTRAAAGPWGWFGVGLVAGGALGNLADRVRDGSVIDYIKFDLWPAFNLADAAITVGVVLLLLGQLQRDRERGSTADAAHLGVEPGDAEPLGAGSPVSRGSPGTPQ